MFFMFDDVRKILDDLYGITPKEADKSTIGRKLNCGNAKIHKFQIPGTCCLKAILLRG
jgi:hypothetical protein